jgi:hypothetical protein
MSKIFGKLFGPIGFFFVLIVAFLLFGLPRILKNWRNKNYLKQVIAYLDSGQVAQVTCIKENISHQIRSIELKGQVSLEAFFKSLLPLPTPFQLLKSYQVGPNEVLLVSQARISEASGLSDGRTSTKVLSLSYLIRLDESSKTLTVMGEFPNDLVEKNTNSAFAEHVQRRV